jgi:hypothetical protein
MPEFDPSKYLTKVGSADYLEVKWRLVWLRTDHPDADIDTQLMSPPDTGEAIFKARITIPSGGAATGWGSETPNDFRDYLEKAETKAIGRALAALGYGTQFCPDFDFGAPAGKLVDAPVTRSKAEPRSLYPPREISQPARTAAEEMQSLHGTANNNALSHQDLHDIAVGRGRGSLSELTAQELYAFNEWLKSASIPAIQKAVEAGRSKAVATK